VNSIDRKHKKRLSFLNLEAESISYFYSSACFLDMHSLPSVEQVSSYQLRPSMSRPYLHHFMLQACNLNCNGCDNGSRNPILFLPSPLQPNNYISGTHGFVAHRQQWAGQFPPRMLPDSVATTNARKRKTRREGSVPKSESSFFESDFNKTQPQTMREKQRAADENPVPADSFMVSHKVSAAPEGAGDNQFDFVLLPSAVNARRGMKLAKPETIACKYGPRCFRKDCRFFHPDKSPSALRVPDVQSSFSLPVTYLSPLSSSYRSLASSSVSSPMSSPLSSPTSSPISTPRQGLSMYISPATSYSSPELVNKKSMLN